MDIELDIEGVSDRAIVGAIQKRVRTLRRQLAQPGDWRVTIAPSETRGQWDLGIGAFSGWQLISFDAPMDQLPDLIERVLRERLVRPMSEAVS